MGERGPGELRYTAFLSYSHRDAAAAGRLHRRLEAYRLPRRLVGAETARGPVPDRLWPIFRDREELPAATDLSQTVREALARSGSLVVLCSPHSAESLWVAEEIETFRRLHPDRPILAAILDGDPPHCFPEKLRAFGQDGTWHEPLATDLRRGGDGAQLGLLKLVAGITGVGLDDLVQRDAQRKIRRVTAVTAAALVAMLMMAALTLVALNARNEAERQRVEARGLAEFMHTDLRKGLSSVGRLDIMRTVNERALAYYDRQLQLYDRPADRLMRARILQAIGEDNLARGNEAAALSLFRETYETTSALLAASPGDPERIFGHAQSEYWLGYVDYRRDDFAGARPRWRRYKTLAGGLAAIDPANPRWLRELAYAEGNLCTLAVAPPVDAAEARRACDAALAALEAIRRAMGNDPALILDIANRHAWAADAWNLSGSWDRVQEHRDRQHRLAQWLIAREPDNLDYQDFWMRTQFGFGELLKGRGERRRAQPWFAGAARTAAMLRAHDPENASWLSFQRRIAEAMDPRG